jgi:hypothetical protein
MVAPKLLPVEKRNERCNLTDNYGDNDKGFKIGENCSSITQMCKKGNVLQCILFKDTT